MRVVWIILALLLLAGAAAVWNSMTADDVDAEALRQATLAAEVPSNRVGAGGSDAAAGVDAPGVPAPATAAGTAAGIAPTVDAAAKTAAAGHATHADASAPTDATAAGPASGTAPDALAQGLAAELVRSAEARRGPAGAAGGGPSSPAASGAPASPPVGEPLLLGLDVKIPSATVVPGSIHELADGSIGADDRFVIRGAGTAEDPYVVTWELLVSASETYQPRQGRTEIPQRVAMLSGKHVRIQGYAAFPAFSFDPTDMLMMLNRWDGCCIGVPPTPFDAIEVKLSVVPKDNRRMVAYFGSVEGKLAVEPYLADSWLVGLYVMSDARFRLDL